MIGEELRLVDYVERAARDDGAQVVHYPLIERIDIHRAQHALDKRILSW